MELATNLRRIICGFAIVLLLPASGCGAGFYLTIGDHDTVVAVAGPAQDVRVGVTVTLDGSASSGGWYLLVSYRWTIISVPGGSSVNTVASGPAPFTGSFVPDVTGNYLMMLTVTDSRGISSTDTVSITARTI